MPDLSEKTITVGGESYTLRRRTNASRAYLRLLLGKTTDLIEALAEQTKLDKDAVDSMLLDYLLLSSQIVGGEAVFALPSDKPDTLMQKCVRWMLDFNPDATDALIEALYELNQAWGDRATAPLPLPEDADPN